MKKTISIIIFLMLILTGVAIIPLSVSANTVESSTINFEGALDYDGTGYIGVLPCVVDGGFDIFADEGSSAWFGDDPGTGPVWTEEVIGADHDAWPTWDPDTPDWYQYSIEFFEDGGVYKWALRNHPGATDLNPWYDEVAWGPGGKPPMGVPMSGVVYWYSGGAGGYAVETDTGAYLPATGTPEIPGGAASKGDCAHAWDMDWSWGSEYVPLEYPGFEIDITDLGSGDYMVALIPSKPGWTEKVFDPDSGELGSMSHVTINIFVPTGLKAIILDLLPMHMRYVGNFEFDGDDTLMPTCYGEDYVYHKITDSGMHTIEFDVKIVEAKSWEETVVYNWVGACYYNDIMFYEYDEVPFTILPFEELQKYVEWDKWVIPKADVVFSFDLTSSMSGHISAVKTHASNIINHLQTTIDDVAFGVISHSDYPITVNEYCGYSAPYGSGSDFAYNLDLDVTTDASTTLTTIAGLTLQSGGDGPQDYTRILYESMGLSWRPDATKILVVFGDSPTHDCDFYDLDDDGTAADDFPGWGLISTGGDPGPDGAVGGGDDLDFETVVSDVADTGIKVLTIDCLNPLTPNDYDAMGDLSFNYMADETDGGYYELSSASEVSDAIESLIKAQAKKETNSYIVIPTKTDIHWTLVIEVTNSFGYTMEDVVITDRFGGDIEVHTPALEISHGNIELKEKGKTKKQFLTWEIADLLEGETATLKLEISPDINTGTGNNKKSGHQEYTSPGWHDLNSGATLKFIDPEQDMQLSAYTNSIPVLALPLLEEITVDAKDNSQSNPVSSELELDNGVEYLLMVTGIANAGGLLDFDAKYATNNDWATWGDLVPGYEVYGPSLLQLHVDGVSIDWGLYSPQHVYYYVITGDGTTIDFYIRDIYPDNNAGELTVYIMEMP
jgi:hypothetical protein